MEKYWIELYTDIVSLDTTDSRISGTIQMWNNVLLIEI